jgi:hypothetical protein
MRAPDSALPAMDTAAISRVVGGGVGVGERAQQPTRVVYAGPSKGPARVLLLVPVLAIGYLMLLIGVLLYLASTKRWYLVVAHAGMLQVALALGVLERTGGCAFFGLRVAPSEAAP